MTGHRVMRAGPLVAVRLGLAERDEVMEMRRVRFLNEEPLSLDITCVPVATGRRLVAEDRQDRDLLPILENDYGYSLEQSDLGIEAVVAGSEVAAALAIAPGAPVLRIERVTHAAGGQPIAFELLHYRGDAFLYRLNVKRQRGGPAQ